jgi:beta-N-acetylhexosaminidase
MKKAVLLLISAILAAVMLVAGGCGQEQAGDLTAGLSTQEKVGQLFLVGFEGTQLTLEIEEMLTTIHPAGVILFGRNIQDADQLRKLIVDLQDVAMNDTGIPLLVATDQEGGQITRIPWLDDGVSEAETSDSEQAYHIGLQRAQALADLGINVNLAPVLDMGMPGDFLSKYGRTFQGGPEQVGELGSSVIHGQKDGGIFSTAKHFPGYGGIDFDPENDMIPVVPGIPEISQFRIACEADPKLVMTANVIYTELDADYPLALSPAGIAFLRQELGDAYLVVTDDLASKVLKNTYTLPGTVTLAARAGVDILLISANEPGDPMEAYNALMEAVNNQEISEEDLNERVGKILRLKQRITPGDSP